MEGKARPEPRCTTKAASRVAVVVEKVDMVRMDRRRWRSCEGGVVLKERLGTFEKWFITLKIR